MAGPPKPPWIWPTVQRGPLGLLTTHRQVKPWSPLPDWPEMREAEIILTFCENTMVNM